MKELIIKLLDSEINVEHLESLFGVEDTFNFMHFIYSNNELDFTGYEYYNDLGLLEDAFSIWCSDEQSWKNYVEKFAC